MRGRVPESRRVWRGYSLNRYEYYRRGHIAALSATYAALGSTSTVRIAGYNKAKDQMAVTVSWI